MKIEQNPKLVFPFFWQGGISSFFKLVLLRADNFLSLSFYSGSCLYNFFFSLSFYVDAGISKPHKFASFILYDCYLASLILWKHKIGYILVTTLTRDCAIVINIFHPRKWKGQFKGKSLFHHCYLICE